MKRSGRNTKKMGEMDKKAARGKYVLVLFVAGREPNSVKAENNLRKICKEHLPGRFEIEIVDVLKDFQSALDSNVFVTPMLILAQPLPEARVAGNLCDEKKVLAALRLTGA